MTQENKGGNGTEGCLPPRFKKELFRNTSKHAVNIVGHTKKIIIG